MFLSEFGFKFDIMIVSNDSKYGIGAIILHKQKNDFVKVISHAARTHLSDQKNYNRREEALGIIFAVKNFANSSATEAFS